MYKKSKININIKHISIVVMVLLSAWLLGLAHTVDAADSNITDGITVDSTLDTPDDNIGDGICDDGDGNCTLRAAIEEANTNSDLSTINFSITPLDNTVKKFTPATAYPTVTEPIIIDGSTQNGADCSSHTLRVEIDAASSNDQTILNIRADDSALRGFAFFGHDSAGQMVKFAESNGGDVVCNNFGASATGEDEYEADDFHGSLGVEGHSNLTVGGTTPSDRNVFSYNRTQVALVIYENVNTNTSPDDNVVIGNYFGFDTAGVTAAPNTAGDVSITAGSNNRVGGTAEGESNVFLANSAAGLGSALISSTGSVEASGNSLIGNTFGYTATGQLAVGGGATTAITIGRAPGTPGTTNTLISDNKIATSAIAVLNMDLGGAYNTGVSILDNQIVGASFGIDNCQDSDFSFSCDVSDGATPNDIGDVDTGSNNYINTPEITGISQVGDEVTFTYDLDAIDSPSDSYRVDFFSNDNADSEGMGQSQNFIGTTTADLSGGAAIGLTATFSLADNSDITDMVFSSTTTAVDDSATYGYGSTSEFGGVADDVTISYDTSSQSGSDNATNNTAGNESSAPEGSLADTGQDISFVRLGALIIALSLVVSLMSRRKFSYTLGHK